MKNTIYTFILLSIISSHNIFAMDIEMVANSLNLSAGSKAIMQWKRVFKSERKMKRYNINGLDKETKKRLEEYLIDHAIDSDKPTVAGGF